MKKILISEKGRKFLVKGAEFHSNHGRVDIEEGEESVESHLGHRFAVLDPDLIDIYEKMPRAGSYMLKKDMGMILGYLGVGTGAVVVDAGTGSGALAIFLGNVAGTSGRVYSYEHKPEFAAVAEENVKTAGLGDVVSVGVRDVLEGFREDTGTVDFVTLDLNEAWKTLEEARRILRRGGRIAIYNPYIEHARLVHNRLVELGFMEIQTLESVTREMEFRVQGTRPKTSRVGHSGYLTFARKV
ncbi:tRNA (adenine(58)-N(1))-methyltransferase TrmI [archaeon BMS3Abin16]|nr:tRNA (adenine(58)-N(1))-methyltransferase TrmI [archaeon BMS3Abin16]